MSIVVKKVLLGNLFLVEINLDNLFLWKQKLEDYKQTIDYGSFIFVHWFIYEVYVIIALQRNICGDGFRVSVYMNWYDLFKDLFKDWKCFMLISMCSIDIL